MSFFNPSYWFLSPLMLAGLAALALPPIIHLLNRRRYDVVDWGAMQFLQVSEVTRRRLMIEELLLMLLRMGLLAVLVFALAGPLAPPQKQSAGGPRPNRDVVLIFDGSYSMGATTTGKSAHEAAKEWARAFISDLTPGDTVAVLQAKQQPVPVLRDPSSDMERVREHLDKLPPPAGGCDWQPALEEARTILDKSRRERAIILLSDGQRFGWADPDSLFRWDQLKKELGPEKSPYPGTAPRPRLWVVNVDPARTKKLPNWDLTSLRSNRPVVPAGREVKFRTEIELHGQTAYVPPHAIRLEVDGKYVKKLDPPRGVKLREGKVPFSFTHRFVGVGSHLVSLVLDPDPPIGQRPAGYVIKDHVPGDNRQDFAVEVVPAVPVLIVDGDPRPLRVGRGGEPDPRGSDFLRKALSPAGDLTPSVRTRVVPVSEFVPALLTGEPEARPRVLILSNVAKLEDVQREAVEQFLADGGGVLVTLGERVEREEYNSGLYRAGQGWLPARVDAIQGREDQPQNGVHPSPSGTNHPTLELFRDTPGGLTAALFPRWWKVTTAGRNAPGVPVALFRSATAAYPFLVERAYRAGRVLLCTVPLDNSWGTNLVDLPAFVPLAHELVYYLAGARSAEFNLQPGQPLRYRLDNATSLEGFTLQPPAGEVKPLSTIPTEPDAYPAQLLPQAHGSVLVHDGTRETGVYRLKTPAGQTVYYVVKPDARESDLTPASESDRKAVSDLVGLTYQNDRTEILGAAPESEQRAEVWWWLLLGLIGLLCFEVWMTRRIVKNR